MKTTNLGEADGLSPIEWSQVEPQLADLLVHDDPSSPNRPTFWLTTLNADGSPHVTSVGALWHAGSCWFQTGERTRKARNVARDPRCTISVATKGFDVMVAGEARRVTEPSTVAEIAALWAQSGWPAQPDDSGTGITAPFNAPTLGPPPWYVYELEPQTATAVGTTAEAPGSTRWLF
ncbi:MAG TPA: pyridoxamine 5'-phosphate oxidase family protein [Ilumatobacteraceae bacterium]